MTARPRLRLPALTPNTLLALILITGLMGLAALVQVSLVGAKQVEDRATSAATAQSLCSLIALFLPKPGDAPSTTERGRVVVSRFQSEYERLHCSELPAGPVPSVSPR